jgi:hypothetical protein
MLDGDDASDDAWLGERVVDFDKGFFFVVGGFVFWEHGAQWRSQTIHIGGTVKIFLAS